MKNKKNKKGFTLAELLIVVAIIAVLVAIAIPVFSAQLANARLATDAANVRAHYAELAVEKIDGDTASWTPTASDFDGICKYATVSISGNNIVVTYSPASKSPVTIPFKTGS